MINHLIRSIRVHLFIVIPEIRDSGQSLVCSTSLPAEGSQAIAIEITLLQLPCEEVPSKLLPVVFHDILYALLASGQDWEPCENCPQTIFLPDVIRTYQKKKKKQDFKRLYHEESGFLSYFERKELDLLWKHNLSGHGKQMYNFMNLMYNCVFSAKCYKCTSVECHDIIWYGFWTYPCK